MVDIDRMHEVTGIPKQKILGALGVPPVVMTEQEAEQALQQPLNLRKIDHIIQSVSRTGDVYAQALKKREELLRDYEDRAVTIFDLYHVYRHVPAQANKDRKRLRGKINHIFYIALARAKTQRELVGLYKEIPSSSKSLAYLRHEVIRKLAGFFPS